MRMSDHARHRSTAFQSVHSVFRVGWTVLFAQTGMDYSLRQGWIILEEIEAVSV